jgi:hypothetical protein
MIRIGLGIDAERTANGLAGRTRQHTRALQTCAPGSADRTATAAMRIVRQQVDALRAAVGESRRTRALAADTLLARWTRVAAGAAMSRVGCGVNAARRRARLFADARRRRRPLIGQQLGWQDRADGGAGDPANGIAS